MSCIGLLKLTILLIQIQPYQSFQKKRPQPNLSTKKTGPYQLQFLNQQSQQCELRGLVTARHVN